MANGGDGDPLRPPLAEEDDWFHIPSVGPIEPGEVAWQDEPELPPRSPSGGLGRRQVVVGLAVVVAVGLVAAGVLIVRAIGGSGGKTAAPGSTAQVPTTPTPVQTGSHPAATGGTTAPRTLLVPTGTVLRAGSAGAAVKGLQRALTGLGYAPGVADGSFGPATTQAVIAFQKAHGLPEDGIAGAKTIAAINTALGP